MKLTIRFWILISLLLLTVTKVFTNISVAQSKAALAKKFPSLVVIYPSWDNASITHNPLIFNDLEGNPQFYLFGIFKENKNLGYCAIGARKNLPFLFEASILEKMPIFLKRKCFSVE